MSEEIKKTLEALRARAFDSRFAETCEEARNIILDLIPENAVVGVGDSATIKQVGVLEEMEKRGIVVLNPFAEGIPHSEHIRLVRESIRCDVFLTGTNAVTLDGKLVNVDAVGNRVASMIFGPERVILAMGRNKIVNNVDEAFNRLRNVIAPQHARMKGFRTPCALTGRCSDCITGERICRAFTIMEMRPLRTDVTVVLINKDLGLGWSESWPAARIAEVQANYEQVTLKISRPDRTRNR